MTYQPPVPVPTEFALLAEGCRWCFAGDNGDTVARLAQDSDWARVVALARRHRVEGLAWHALHSLGIAMPETARDALADDARRIAGHGLCEASQSVAIHVALQADGVDHLFVKGLAVGKLAYGNPFLKMSADIDVLVGADRVEVAGDALAKLGFEPPLPARRDSLAAWHRTRKESVWRDEAGLVVELHSRLADNVRLIAGIGLGSPRQRVEVAPGIVLPTLQGDELFAYLCVHGASSAWFRLKWLADLAALIHQLNPDEIATLHDRSRLLGAGRAAAQGLLLSTWLLGVELGRLAARLDRGPARWLAVMALDQMLDPREPTERRLGTATIHLSQLLLHPGPGFAAGELYRQLREIMVRR